MAGDHGEGAVANGDGEDDATVHGGTSAIAPLSLKLQSSSASLNASQGMSSLGSMGPPEASDTPTVPDSTRGAAAGIPPPLRYASAPGALLPEPAPRSRLAGRTSPASGAPPPPPPGPTPSEPSSSSLQTSLSDADDLHRVSSAGPGPEGAGGGAMLLPSSAAAAAPSHNRYSSGADDDEEEAEARFDLETWRRFYRLNKGNPSSLLGYLWRRFDPKQHSIFCATFRGQDQMFAGFQGDNVIHGYCCRVEAQASGTQLFGLMHTLTKGSDVFKVLGVFIVPGDALPSALASLPDSDEFQLLKADTSDPLVRQFVGQLVVGASPVPDFTVVFSRELGLATAGAADDSS